MIIQNRGKTAAHAGDQRDRGRDPQHGRNRPSSQLDEGGGATPFYKGRGARLLLDDRTQ